MADIEISEYMANMITEKLTGATITGSVVLSPSWLNSEPKFGMSATLKGGQNVVVWVDCDAEGNGAGWLSITAKEEG